MIRSIQKWLPIEACEHGKLYRIHARNFKIGVYNGANKSFVGIRRKFNATFLDREFHWDTGEPFGTVKPDSVLEEMPEGLVLGSDLDSQERAVFAWLRLMEGKYTPNADEDPRR